jgi:UDP-N-acetylglucosamine--N-acetylmuramyl-(pentapeptide) pyrophosphoryl-undecaprenol N-acetylglucosamine transferase
MALLRQNPELIVVTGGGTGGHALAGITLAEEWKSRIGPQADVLFIGAHGGLEEKLVPRAGIKLELLSVGSLNRVSWRKQLSTLFRLPLALLQASALLLRERPRFVIGVGGYAAGPVVLMGSLLGWLWGAKTALLEQNLVPGLTNRLLSRFATRVFAAFPGTLFPGRAAEITGNPIRSKFRPLAPATASPFTVFVFGGSQGALGINTLVLEALPHLKTLGPAVSWIHQTGERDFEHVRQGHEAAGSKARVEKFIYEMEDCYQSASLVVCRAGASTLSELARVKRAAILVPLPTAADNHQEKNARVFETAGACQVLLQGSEAGAELARRIQEFIAHPEKLRQMEESIACFSRPNAGKDLIDALLSTKPGA